MRLRAIISHARIGQKLPFLLRHYQYEPLPSPTCIRLLEIIPSGNDAIVRCSLKAFELDTAPSFKALSYTWGRSSTTINALETELSHESHAWIRQAIESSTSERIASETRKHSIICDGRLLKVTSNLRDALRMLGKALNMPKMPKTPSYYWIDALCMNQNDINERNAQVARMSDVFRRADGVVVWFAILPLVCMPVSNIHRLGREDEFTKDAITTMQKISAIPEQDWPKYPYTSFYEPRESRLGYDINVTFHNWLGFIALINRPWFKRAWVSGVR